MVFSATFNNISGISWRSVLLVEETGLPGENHRPVQVTDKHYYKRLYRVHLSWAGPEFTTLVVIDTDCTSSCKSNEQPDTLLININTITIEQPDTLLININTITIEQPDTLLININTITIEQSDTLYLSTLILLQ
jgi:hypothetical protein